MSVVVNVLASESPMPLASLSLNHATRLSGQLPVNLRIHWLILELLNMFASGGYGHFLFPNLRCENGVGFTEDVYEINVTTIWERGSGSSTKL